VESTPAKPSNSEEQYTERLIQSLSHRVIFRSAAGIIFLLYLQRLKGHYSGYIDDGLSESICGSAGEEIPSCKHVNGGVGGNGENIPGAGLEEGDSGS